MVKVQNELLDEQRMVRDMQARRECGNTEFRNVKYAKAYDAYTGALQGTIAVVGCCFVWCLVFVCGVGPCTKR